MEFQPPAVGSVPMTNGASRPDTGEWPAVPPAPTPVKLPASVTPPEPPLMRAPVSRSAAPMPTDDSPTVAIRAPHAPSPVLLSPTRQSPALLFPRREPPGSDTELIWQSAFAHVTGSAIVLALVALTSPLWIAVFRLAAATDDDGKPQVRSLVALCMMLMGAFLTGAATWMIIIEMRARARIVDALARAAAPAHFDGGQFDPALLDAQHLQGHQLDPAQLGPTPGEMNQPVTAPIPATAMPGAAGPAPARRHPVALDGSFGSLLRAFGQLPAQIALLGIALALFVGAIVLSG